jgi:signal transduction histidine kinase
MLPIQRPAARPATCTPSSHFTLYEPGRRGYRHWIILFVASLVVTVSSQLGLPRADQLMLSSGAAGIGLALVLGLSTLTTLVQRARDAAETERSRVVRDLHDGAQQRMVHAVITLKLAQRALRTGGDAEVLMGEALSHAEHAIRELRELAHGVQPPAVTQGGLRAGVESLALRVPVRVTIDVNVGRLPPPVETNAYFIVAEALTNVVKHSRASAALVRAKIADEMLRLQIRDDGVGGARIDGGPGLRGLRDRAESLGGRMRVDSPVGGGTALTVRLPLPAGELRGPEPRRAQPERLAEVA